MLAVGHELKKSLSEVEEMTASEIHLHLAFMAKKSRLEREAAERAKGGGRWKPMVSFKR